MSSSADPMECHLATRIFKDCQHLCYKAISIQILLHCIITFNFIHPSCYLTIFFLKIWRSLQIPNLILYIH